jgi:CRP/FNR family cyclic AMP-dependent transcriptional regulator
VPILSKLELIQRIPLFSTLTPRQAQVIGDATTQRTCLRGENIVEQGKKSDALYIILRGRAQVLLSHPTRGEAVLAILRHGEYVGEMSLIDNAPHSATVRTLTHTSLLVLERHAFAQCLPQNSSMAYAVMNGLVRRLRHANLNITSLALMDMQGRVIKALLELSETDRDGNAVISHTVSRQDIGKMTGASRETASRMLKSLEERGFIELRADGSTLVREHIHQLR